MELSRPMMLRVEKRNFNRDYSPVKRRNISTDFFCDKLQINEFELFLKKKQSNITLNKLSIIDLEYAKEKYNKIKNANNACYISFGSEAHGFIFYTLYKSKSNKIFIFKLTLKAIHSYIEIKDSTWFNS